MTPIFTPRNMAIILLCGAINGGLGLLVQSFKLPIYLDLCGSILCIAILGLRPGLISAAIGVFLLGLTVGPTYFPYIGTALLVTAAAWWFRKFGYLEKLIPTLVGGLLLGLISAVASAPVTAFLFGGISLVGADAVTAVFRATGQNIMTSVFLGGVATDPVDKVLASILCFGVYQSLPQRLRELRQPATKGPAN